MLAALLGGAFLTLGARARAAAPRDRARLGPRGAHARARRGAGGHGEYAGLPALFHGVPGARFRGRSRPDVPAQHGADARARTRSNRHHARACVDALRARTPCAHGHARHVPRESHALHGRLRGDDAPRAPVRPRGARRGRRGASAARDRGGARAARRVARVRKRRRRRARLRSARCSRSRRCCSRCVWTRGLRPRSGGRPSSLPRPPTWRNCWCTTATFRAWP